MSPFQLGPEPGEDMRDGRDRHVEEECSTTHVVDHVKIHQDVDVLKVAVRQLNGTVHAAQGHNTHWVQARVQHVKRVGKMF